MASDDVPDLGGVVEGVEGSHQLVTGEPEDDLDPLGLELVDERNRAGTGDIWIPCHELIYYQNMGRVVDSPSAALVAASFGEPLPRAHTSDLVAEHVRRLIFSGVLRPGDKVPQDELAAALQVSRQPVREAMLGMARDGLVVLEPHLGAYVGAFDADVLRDHFEIVGLVQGLAAARLSAGAAPDVVAALAGVRAEVKAATEAAAVHRHTMEFHRLINRAGASERQRSVLRALARMLPSGFFPDVPGAERSERIGVERIWKTIRSGQPEQVRATCLTV